MICSAIYSKCSNCSICIPEVQGAPQTCAKGRKHDCLLAASCKPRCLSPLDRSAYRHSNSATYSWHDCVMPATTSCPAALANPIQRESPRKEMPRPSVLPPAAAAELPPLPPPSLRGWGRGG